MREGGRERRNEGGREGGKEGGREGERKREREREREGRREGGRKREKEGGREELVNIASNLNEDYHSLHVLTGSIIIILQCVSNICVPNNTHTNIYSTPRRSLCVRPDAGGVWTIFHPRTARTNI